jgi:hypothetical protein
VETRASHRPWKTLRVSHSSHRLDGGGKGFIHHVGGHYWYVAGWALLTPAVVGIFLVFGAAGLVGSRRKRKKRP